MNLGTDQSPNVRICEEKTRGMEALKLLNYIGSEILPFDLVLGVLFLDFYEHK